jgi:hypothetical protein
LVTAKPRLDHDPQFENLVLRYIRLPGFMYRQRYPYDQAPYYISIKGMQIKYRAKIISVLIGDSNALSSAE